jgi:hypothetical protein
VAGLIWSLVSPRALLQEIGRGEAELVNAESRAFISADAWFVVITAVAGLITGIIGYRLAVRRGGWLGAAGVVLGALVAALVAVVVGENIGLGTYNHLLATSAQGTYFRSSLSLGAKSALAFWPLLASIVILVAESGSSREAKEAEVNEAGEAGGAP